MMIRTFLRHSTLTTVLCGFLLTGCVAAFLAGAAAGGIVVSDQRDVATIKDDSFIYHRILSRIVKDPVFSESHIVISSFNRVVLLVGQTPVASLKVTAEKIAGGTPNVTRVYNEITIAPPATMKERSYDTWITTTVKAHMLAEKGLRSGSIKVVTEARTVFLMGVLTKSQADLAVEVARQVEGVERVVKVFQYIT